MFNGLRPNSMALSHTVTSYPRITNSALLILTISKLEVNRKLVAQPHTHRQMDNPNTKCLQLYLQDERTHNKQHGYLSLQSKTKTKSNLWCCDNNGTRYVCRAEQVNGGEMFIRSARWSVDNEVVQFTPVNLLQERLDHLCTTAASLSLLATNFSAQFISQMCLTNFNFLSIINLTMTVLLITIVFPSNFQYFCVAPQLECKERERIYLPSKLHNIDNTYQLLQWQAASGISPLQLAAHNKNNMIHTY